MVGKEGIQVKKKTIYSESTSDLGIRYR